MKNQKIKTNCLPLLIGSLPIDDHKKAIEIVAKYSPKIPLWVQLPCYRQEGMIEQFLPGFISVSSKNDTQYIDTLSDTFDEELLKFYEDYMAIVEQKADILNSRFSFSKDVAPGFFQFIDFLKDNNQTPFAVKGQITGPITFGTSVKDENGKAIFYNEQLKDAMTKMLTLKAKWQVKKLSDFNCPVIMFFDEPALAGFGSTAFLGISETDINDCISEVDDAVKQEGGLSGVHVCANTQWPLLLDTTIDVISFDAYSYFDRFILYKESINKFIDRGGIIALGIVPTSDIKIIESETVESLFLKFKDQIKQLEKIGLNKDKVLSQMLITPSCGTGSLSLDHALKVLTLTKELSEKIIKEVLND